MFTKEQSIKINQLFVQTFNILFASPVAWICWILGRAENTKKSNINLNQMGSNGTHFYKNK